MFKRYLYTSEILILILQVVFDVTWIAGRCHWDRVLNLGLRLPPVEGRRLKGLKIEALMSSAGIFSLKKATLGVLEVL